MTMQQRRLGSTGVWVSELCLGAMMFGEWGTKDHEESIRIIHRALDAGITFVDTADVYSAGESEVIVGKALAGHRDDIVLATKAFMPMSDNLNHGGSSRRWIIREAEDSLRRLDIDWIDLYQIHRWDPETDLDALSDLVHQGKIRCQSAIAALSLRLGEAQPDVAVIIGDDQRELFLDDGIPAFACFAGDELVDMPPSGEALDRMPDGIRAASWAVHADEPASHPVCAELGLHIAGQLTGAEFDVTVFTRQPAGRSLGHAFTFPRYRLGLPAASRSSRCSSTRITRPMCRQPAAATRSGR